MIRMKIKRIEDFPDVKEAIIAILHLSSDADFSAQNPLELDGVDFQPDLIIRDRKKIYILLIRNLPEQEDIAQLALVKSLAPKAFRDYHFVIAAKKIPNSFQTLASKFDDGLQVVQLPYSVPVESLRDDGGKITPSKAWKVVEQLLPPGTMAPSIQKIADNAGVSYGWVHTVVNRLVAKGIADIHAHFIKIIDAGRLLDVVALERPIGRDMDLNRGIIQTEYRNSFDAATAITNMLDAERNVKFAFTAHTAVTLYTGYAVNHDSVYLYLDDVQLYRRMKKDEPRVLGGVKLHVLKPDRDVFANTWIKKNVRIVDKAQALLDIAGFGMPARAVAADMVKKYGAL